MAACNKIDQHGLLRLIYSHCGHSGDVLPICIQCWVFYQCTMIQCFVVRELCFTHIKWSTIREYLGVRKDGGWGLQDEASLHCRNSADRAIVIDRPCLFSDLSEVQEPCVTEAQFAKGVSRGQSKTNTVLVQWKSLKWGSVCQSPQFSLNGSDEWRNDWQSKCVVFFFSF